MWSEGLRAFFYWRSVRWHQLFGCRCLVLPRLASCSHLPATQLAPTSRYYPRSLKPRQHNPLLILPPRPLSLSPHRSHPPRPLPQPCLRLHQQLLLQHPRLFVRLFRLAHQMLLRRHLLRLVLPKLPTHQYITHFGAAPPKPQQLHTLLLARTSSLPLAAHTMALLRIPLATRTMFLGLTTSPAR